VEPIPETMRVLRTQLERGDTNLAAGLQRISRSALKIVPECVGLSLASFSDGITYTLVSTRVDVASLDSVQYLDGGPCVESAHEGHSVVSDTKDVLSEDAWQLYARASAAAGIASSLTLPVRNRSDKVIGTVNVYGSTPDAFRGRVEEMAQAIGASAADAVANADLSFGTCLTARHAPEIFEDQYDIDLAVGMLSEFRRCDVSLARERIREAARRAGVTEGQVARTLRAAITDNWDEGDED